MKVFNIIDGYGIFFRSFFGIKEMRNSSGLPIGAVYGFAKALMKILDDYKSDEIVVALDCGAPSFRKEIDPQYKSNRAKTPEDLRPQFAILREMLQVGNIPWLESEGFEADDIIATIVHNNRASGVYSKIFTFDKDLLALIVDGGSEIIDYVKNEIYHESHVLEKFGVRASLVSDYLAIIGDASDNIPGIKGCGPKAARTLLDQFDSLDAILDGIELIKNDNLRKKVAENIEQARLSKKLAILCTEAPINKITFDVSQINFSLLEEFFKKYEIAITIPKKVLIGAKTPILQNQGEFNF